jgi:nucleoside phosphorylase
MSLVYVFAAMRMETRAVELMINPRADRRFSAGSKTWPVESNRVRLFTTGMGPRRAQKCAATAFAVNDPANIRSMPDQGPDAALVIGLCGGLSPSLSEGTIVSYTECLSTDSTRSPVPCSPSLTDQQAALLLSRGIQCERCVGITSPRIGTPIGEKLTLAKSGASAVDMESYEIIAAAAKAGVPTTVLRIVADAFEQRMPDFNRALRVDGDFDGWMALKVALGSPLLTAKLVAANRRAIQGLGKALKIVLAADCFSEANLGKPSVPNLRAGSS